MLNPATLFPRPVPMERITRAFWITATPFAFIAWKVGRASYKWVNVCAGARRRDWFDPIWHWEWYGTPIKEMPTSVNICGLRYRVTVAEGLVLFRCESTSVSIQFERDPHEKYAFLWYSKTQGHVPTSHHVEAYKWIKAVYGGSHEIKKPPLRKEQANDT